MLILMDEPTASLDPDIADKLLSLIENLRKTKNTSILYTSHDMEEVTRICDEVIFLDKGKIIAQDSPLGLTKRISKAQVRLTFDGENKILEKYFKKEKLKFKFQTKNIVTIDTKEEKVPKLIFSLSKLISWRRVKSILLEEYFISKRSLEIFFDIPFFAFTSLLLAGFIASFISSSIGIIGAQYLILGMILWECLRITQYSMSVSVLWEIWSRNLSNIFISPISIVEYFISLMISSILKITIMSTMLSLIAFFFL